MNIYGRQGDLVIEKLAAPITGELEATKRIVFAGDSSGHPHTLLGAAQFRREGRRTLVRVEKALAITHGKPDGHATVTLEPGDYAVHPLRERGDGSDRAVED